MFFFKESFCLNALLKRVFTKNNKKILKAWFEKDKQSQKNKIIFPSFVDKSSSKKKPPAIDEGNVRTIK